MSRTEARAPSFLFLLLALGLLAMCETFIQQSMDAAASRTVMEKVRSLAPELFGVVPDSGGIPSPSAGIAESPDDGGSPDGGLALTERQADDLTALMRRLQANPNDADTLIELGDAFLTAGEWARAAAFLHRAVLSRPGDVRPRYMLGICLYRQEKIEEARRTYEDLLAIREDPPALYNLALLYKYHLDDDDEAARLLRKIVDSPDADADTLERAKKELAE
jgi:uncharacterized protein HemY